jgi:hypothetical protein
MTDLRVCEQILVKWEEVMKNQDGKASNQTLSPDLLKGMNEM